MTEEKYISSEEKLRYFERLIHKNGNSSSLFIEQYLNGSGSELEKKFWNKNSSSRLCFDLYSWLCMEKSVRGFCFEKKLPGVLWKRNTVAGPPNMDVYFEKENKVVFIESKYTELSDWKYIDKRDIDRNGNYPLSEAYWKDGMYKSSKLTLGERFYNNDVIAKKFRSFCLEVQNIIDSSIQSKASLSWFDPKQETCHLFGIIFYILFGGEERFVAPENNRFVGKDIILANNVWNCSESDNFNTDGTLVDKFKEKAEEMLNSIFEKLNCRFTFTHFTIQDVLDDKFLNLKFSSAKLFGVQEPQTVKEFIFENYKCSKR